MKKFFAILLGLVIAVPAMAANVNDINRQAYLHHLKEMNGMRKGIVKLLSKSDRTAEEQKMLDELSAKFDEKQAGWDSYLNAVASDDEEGRAVVEQIRENLVKTRRRGLVDIIDTVKKEVEYVFS